MINMCTVNTALEELLNSELPDEYKIVRAEHVNKDPGRCPWVGIYRGSSQYTPRAMASHNSGKKWTANPGVRILIQAASGLSGKQAEERLEEYIAAVMDDVILQNPTISGTVRTITGFDIEYSFNEETENTMFYHMATIDIKLEART